MRNYRWIRTFPFSFFLPERNTQFLKIVLVGVSYKKMIGFYPNNLILRYFTDVFEHSRCKSSYEDFLQKMVDCWTKYWRHARISCPVKWRLKQHFYILITKYESCLRGNDAQMLIQMLGRLNGTAGVRFRQCLVILIGGWDPFYGVICNDLLNQLSVEYNSLSM